MGEVGGRGFVMEACAWLGQPTVVDPFQVIIFTNTFLGAALVIIKFPCCTHHAQWGGAPTYVDLRRLPPIGAGAPAPIGDDRRWPWPTSLAPSDADTAWRRPSTTMLEPSMHLPPTPRFSLYF